MLRWLLVFTIALILFNAVGGWLKHLGLGRLPGDFSFRWKGREVFVPLASSVVLSLLAAGIGWLV
jgi:hypothetical protein